MKITINCDDDTLILTDENLDNDNFVTLLVKREGEDTGLDVSVDELLVAVQAFSELRANRLERDKLIP